LTDPDPVTKFARFFFRFIYTGYGIALAVMGISFLISFGLHSGNETVNAIMVFIFPLALVLIMASIFMLRLLGYLGAVLNFISFSSPLLFAPRDGAFWGYAFFGLFISSIMWTTTYYGINPKAIE